MVDRFTKFGWAILMKNKKVETILSTFKQWLTSYLKPKKINTDKGGEFRKKCDGNYIKENNIDHITGGHNNPKHQGNVKAFNKNIQEFLYQIKIIKGKIFV